MTRFVALLIASALWAAPPILEIARTAPPEFFGDAAIRLIQSGKIPQKDAQIELLEAAFAVTGSIREPLRLTAIPGTPPDTREIYRGKAGDLALDRLSIQARIIREMATLDRATARSLFDSIARPKLDPRACADPLIADAAPYYDAAAVIAQSAFTEKERQSEAHVQFLVAILAGAQSPNELAAWTKAVQSVALSAPQWRLLAAALAAKLESIAPDYRPFAMSLDSLGAEIRSVAELSGDPGDLDRALRKYVVNQSRAARCSPDLNFVEEEDLKPAKRKEGIKPERVYFDSADSKQLGDALNALRTAENRHARFEDLIRDFGSWNPEGSNVDVFHQKATVLRALFEMTPQGEDRDRVIAMAASLFQNSSAEREAPAEWLWEARTIVEVANRDASKLIAAFLTSGNTSLALYSQLGYFGDSSGTSK